MSRVPITPETRVADLLDAWPELEAVLIAEAPEFRRLRNPVLRRTVARLTTLDRAARIAGLDVRALVARLRQAAGLASDPRPTAPGAVVTAATESEALPDWCRAAAAVERIDADALLDAGDTPLPRVLRAARALVPGAVLDVYVAFRPLPLVDALAAAGFRSHLAPQTNGGFVLHVARL